MENLANKETASTLKPVRPALSTSKMVQRRSSTVSIAGTKRKNDEETLIQSSSITAEAEVGTGKATTQQLPVKKKNLKSSLSRSIRKPRQSSKATPLRKHFKPGQSIRENDNRKKASGIPIGAQKKPISLPVRMPSTNKLKSVGDGVLEEFNLAKMGVDIPDVTTAKPSSTEHSPSKTSPVETSKSIDVFNKDDLYQHLGQLNPAWNIPALKEDEKPMKTFCTKFKIPKKKKKKNSNDADVPNVPAERPVERAAENASVESRSENIQREGEKEDNRSGPLVEVIDGEIVIKQSSVIVVGGRQATEDVDKELAGDGGVVEEDDHGITATYTSFTNRLKPQRWKVDETRLFYTALRQCGTDFSTMEQMYEGFDIPKTRKQLKSKYKRECKKNPKLIDMAMNPLAQIPLDLSLFGDLEIEKVPEPSSTATKQCADEDPTGSTPIKTVSGGPSPVASTSNDRVKDDADQIGVETSQSNNSKQEPPLTPVKVSGKDDGDPINKSEIILDGAGTMEKVEEKPSNSVSDAASAQFKEKSEESILESVDKPIALFGVKKKAAAQRPKFRAARRSKKRKAK